MKKIYTNFLKIIIVLLIIVVLIGSGSIIYKININKNSAEVIIKDNISINYMSGRSFEMKKNETKKEIEFSVISNNQEQNMIHILCNDLIIENGDLKIDLYENDVKIISNNELSAGKSITVSSFIPIKMDETKSYKLVLKKKKNAIVKFTLELVIASSEDPKIGQTIINDNELVVAPVTKIGEEIATTNEGLIMDIDDQGNAYYFRGNVNNNYISFADKLWRIVKINGDGTVKLILDNAELDSNIYENISVDDFENTILVDNNFKVLENLKYWYNENLKNYDSYIAYSNLCTDMTKEGDVYSNSFRNTISYNPTFNCLGEKKLSKIMTLTADEVLYAGGKVNEENKNYYLYNSEINQSWWTVSIAVKDENIKFFEVKENGLVNSEAYANETKKVRPVINLKENTEITGKGTKENPYTVN